jgi:hypothetical protein
MMILRMRKNQRQAQIQKHLLKRKTRRKPTAARGEKVKEVVLVVVAAMKRREGTVMTQAARKIERMEIKVATEIEVVIGRIEIGERTKIGTGAVILEVLEETEVAKIGVGIKIEIERIEVPKIRGTKTRRRNEEAAETV